MTSLIRVAIADDHALFRQGLKSMLRLQQDLQVVAELERADELSSLLDRQAVDLLLLDLHMDRSAFRDIETLSPRVPIIVVTASERVDDAMSAIRAGARGIVFKRFAIEMLMDAIHTVMDDNVWLPPTLQSELTARLRAPRVEALTRREREIVRNVALGLRNSEVAQKLSISEVTVKTHLNNIFQKLGVRDRVELTLHAVRVGIVAVSERP